MTTTTTPEDALPAAVATPSPQESSKPNAAAINSDRYNGNTPQPLDVTDLLDEVDHDGSAVLLRRPDRISISYLPPAQQRGDADAGDCVHIDDNKSGTSLSGLKFRNSSNGAIVIGSIQQQNGTNDSMNPCALLEGSHHSPAYFDVGDVVEYACSVDCAQASGERDSMPAATSTPTAASPIDTDVAGTAQGNNNHLVLNENERHLHELHTMMRESSSNGFATTVCVSTTKSSTDPIRLCQAVVILPKKTERRIASNVPRDTTTSGETIEDNAPDSGIAFFQQGDRLIIKSISKKFDSLFGSAGCAIKEGYIVVGINNYISSILSPDDATSLIDAIVSSPELSQLSITTIASAQMNSPITKWDQVRKVAVAAGGGTMVLTGSALMVTPLHPVGHAMVLGGVGVLGMEFEAPRKVGDSAKKRWRERRWLRRGWSDNGPLEKTGGQGQG